MLQCQNYWESNMYKYINFNKWQSYSPTSILHREMGMTLSSDRSKILFNCMSLREVKSCNFSLCSAEWMENYS